MSSKSAGDDLRQPDFRTPLNKVRGLGSAKEGTQHFIHQRVSAMSNLVLITLFVGVVIALLGEPFVSVRAAFANPFVALVVLGAMLSVTYHMRIGMQVVIEDYVHAELTRMALLVLNTFFALAVALTCAFAVLKMAFAPAILPPSTIAAPAAVAPAT